jgi:hypothetical protein
VYHLAQAMWNITAFLQIELEKEKQSKDMALYMKSNVR